MVKTGLVTGGSERIAMCFCTYNILSGYKIGYSSTGSIKIGMCRYWCNARREIYIYIYRYVHIKILYCMVPYGTILYMLYGTVRYYTLYIYIYNMVPYGTMYTDQILYRTVLC
jgi:hypothetical protein